MKIITKRIPLESRGDVVRIVPIGDVHIGASACNEALLQRTIDRIAADESCYWIGLGDYCEFINVSDKRFSVASLAKWVRMEHLTDIAEAQTERFLDFVRPIAGKCLALVQGNHEMAIQERYENAVYNRIVQGIKKEAGMEAKEPLAVGFYGWLLLKFRRSSEQGTLIRINLHHGFVGGRLAGAKALNMQRWLWSHDCDLALMGHSHNTEIQIETVESLDRNGNVFYHKRVGAFCGSFLETTNGDGGSYSEIGGYMPLKTGTIEITLRPGAEHKDDRVSVRA